MSFKKWLIKNKIKIDSTESVIWVVLITLFLVLDHVPGVREFFGGKSAFWFIALLALFVARVLLALSAKKRGVELIGAFFQHKKVSDRKKLRK